MDRTLSENELERYSRHIVLADVGGAGQQKLKAARVLVIGAGGLGAPLLQYLAAAGLGTIGIVDDDTVSLSNLQRQVIHDTDHIGMPKVESARQAIKRINPHVMVDSHFMHISRDNADELIGAYDIVADGCDNFATRYIVADACKMAGKTLVSAAVSQFDGSLTTLKPHQTRPDGQSYPSYRDIFPKAPPEGALPTCAEAGVLGALTGMIGAMQALEVVKEVVGVGDGLAGRLLLCDARYMRFQMINL